MNESEIRSVSWVKQVPNEGGRWGWGSENKTLTRRNARIMRGQGHSRREHGECYITISGHGAGKNVSVKLTICRASNNHLSFVSLLEKHRKKSRSRFLFF